MLSVFILLVLGGAIVAATLSGLDAGDQDATTRPVRRRGPRRAPRPTTPRASRRPHVDLDAPPDEPPATDYAEIRIGTLTRVRSATALAFLVTVLGAVAAVVLALLALLASAAVDQALN